LPLAIRSITVGASRRSKAVVRNDKCRLRVSRRAGERFDFAEMAPCLEPHQFARQYLPEYLEIIPRMPMTASGKIQKFQLREMAKDASRPRSIEPSL
jgi:acyl-CoA synthetase (AMP-forming)/AMP-acid ligase II